MKPGNVARLSLVSLCEQNIKIVYNLSNKNENARKPLNENYFGFLGAWGGLLLVLYALPRHWSRQVIAVPLSWQ